MLQLDKTRIPVRERSYLELLDLALSVCREHGGALLLAALVGAAPMALVNDWLLRDLVPEVDDLDYEGKVFSYFLFMLILVAWQTPLATAPITLYLSEALFVDQPSPRRMAAIFFKMLPQLLLIQVVLRGVMVLFCVTWAVIYWLWPYLNELILLERNRLVRKGAGTSTLKRCNLLHNRNTGDLFGRWCMGVLAGLLWILALWVGIYSTRLVLSGETIFDGTMYRVYLPIATWFVVGYFTVVRFLSYLDLRIRNEGWEIELRMRAEAARLARQLN
jgi:hypothetical protein